MPSTASQATGKPQPSPTNQDPTRNDHTRPDPDHVGHRQPANQSGDWGRTTDIGSHEASAARHTKSKGDATEHEPHEAKSAKRDVDDIGRADADGPKADRHADGPKADRRGRGHGHGHGLGVRAAGDRRYLWIAFGLIVGFMVVEVVVGLVAGSLVLLADAGHMVSDAAAVGLALFAMRLASRPAAGAYTYGLKRAEILSALANGATLLGLGLFFVVEAVTRLVAPSAVAGSPVLVVALVGVVMNVAATLVLGKADRRSLNVEGSFRHILTDLYAFIGTAIAGGVILLTGFVRADAIASLVVAGLMVKAGVELVRDSGRIILEAAPRGTDPRQVRAAILGVSGVLDVHELHVWEVTSGFPALSAHILVAGDRDCHDRRAALESLLAGRFDIRHTTLQVDHPHTGTHPHSDDPDCPSAP